MANYCEWDMHVKGKKRDLIIFDDWIDAEYDSNENLIYHCYKRGTDLPVEHKIGDRVWDVNTGWDFDNDGCDLDDEICVYYSGGCAWSADGSLFFTEDNDYVINLRTAAEKLNLDIELLTVETGMGFSEHYIIEPGLDSFLERSCEYYSVYIGEAEEYSDLDEDDQSKVPEQDFNYLKEHGEDYYVKSEYHTIEGYFEDWQIV